MAISEAQATTLPAKSLLSISSSINVSTPTIVLSTVTPSAPVNTTYSLWQPFPFTTIPTAAIDSEAITAPNTIGIPGIPTYLSSSQAPHSSETVETPAPDTTYESILIPSPSLTAATATVTRTVDPTFTVNTVVLLSESHSTSSAYTTATSLQSTSLQSTSMQSTSITPLPSSYLPTQGETDLPSPNANASTTSPVPAISSSILRRSSAAVIVGSVIGILVSLLSV